MAADREAHGAPARSKPLGHHQGEARVAQRRLAAHQLFYPAAAGYAALALPAWVLAMSGWLPAWPALADPLGHAQEMLLGFALGVVAGNQLGVAGRRWLIATLAAWAAARVAGLVAPAGVLAAALNATFGALLVLHVAPRLFGSAKKWRNLTLPASIVALALAAFAWPLIREPLMARVTVLLFSLLMVFMGGRVIAPAVAGQLYQQGERLDARVQPGIEAALILLGMAALATVALPVSRLIPACFLLATGACAAIRLARWRLWKLRGRADLFCLAAGYAWLSLGLMAYAVAVVAGRLDTAALHVLTVGALGTLTFNVMAQTWLLKARRSSTGSTLIVTGTTLLAAATVLRVLAALQPQPWLVMAALCWGAAFALLLVLFWRSLRA